MAKFCTKCGSKLEDNAVFCTNCGFTTEKKKSRPFNKSSFYIKVVGAFTALLVIVFVITAVFFTGYESALNDFFDSIENSDSSLMMKAIPECEMEYLEKSLKEYEGYDSVKEYLDDYFNEVMKAITKHYGENISVSYEVINETELSDKKLREVQDDLKASYNAKDIDIAKGYDLKLDITIKGDEGSDTQNDNLKVVKIDGDWHIVEYSVFDLLERASLGGIE